MKGRCMPDGGSCCPYGSSWLDNSEKCWFRKKGASPKGLFLFFESVLPLVGFEQFNRVTGGIFEQDLLASLARDYLVAEGRALLFQMLHGGS